MKLKQILILLFSLSLLSCGSTKFVLTDGQVLRVPKGSIVLVTKFPGDSESMAQQNFDKLIDKLDRPCIRLLYMPEVTYDFIAAGIDVDLLYDGDSTMITKLQKWMPKSYFLSIDVEYNRSKYGTIKYKHEKIAPNDSYMPVRETALYVTLQSVADPSAIWSFRTESKIKGMYYKDAGINIVHSAFRKAMNQTANYLKEKSIADCPD